MLNRRSGVEMVCGGQSGVGVEKDLESCQAYTFCTAMLQTALEVLPWQTTRAGHLKDEREVEREEGGGGGRA